MKFIHFADVHIGSWRDSQLRDIAMECFCAAIDKAITSCVDFVLLPGDLFNTSLPTVDQLKIVTKKFHELQSKSIPCYIIPGSHDFSASGKTMIDVLEAAGLVTNVMKGTVIDGKIHLHLTIDQKTGAKITGIIGKKGMLDKHYYESLAREELEKESGFKIFLYHTAIEEFKPRGLEKMEAMAMSHFPKGFSYYAGGHVHVRMNENLPGYERITLPGSLFPVNFDELEKFKHGGVFVYDDSKPQPLEWEAIDLYPVVSFEFKCDGKTAEQVRDFVFRSFQGKSFTNTLVTLRFEGQLEGASLAGLDFRSIFDHLYAQGAKAVVKNTLHLTTRQYEEIKVSLSSVDELEDSLIAEHTGKFQLGVEKQDEIALVKSFLKAFDTHKKEGETVSDFERRVLLEAQDASALLRQRYK